MSERARDRSSDAPFSRGRGAGHRKRPPPEEILGLAQASQPESEMSTAKPFQKNTMPSRTLVVFGSSKSEHLPIRKAKGWHTLCAVPRTESDSQEEYQRGTQRSSPGHTAFKGGVAMSWIFVALGGVFILGACLGTLLAAMVFASAHNG